MRFRLEDRTQAASTHTGTVAQENKRYKELEGTLEKINKVAGCKWVRTKVKYMEKALWEILSVHIQQGFPPA